MGAAQDRLEIFWYARPRKCDINPDSLTQRGDTPGFSFEDTPKCDGAHV